MRLFGFNISAKKAAKDQRVEKCKWIPVTDRLPEERERVLASEEYDPGKRELVFIAYRTEIPCVSSDGVFKGMVNRWFDDEGFTMDTVAWMPLPEAYKRDGNDY